MPNTLVHLGVQSVTTKTLFREADLKWIALGCIIPDVPWIIQRVVYVLNETAVPDGLRLYFIVQSSLFFCLILSAALSVLASDARRIFVLLAMNSLLHLLLDALQIKWANGVLLLAPFSWRLISFDLLWPEHWIFYLLTAAGLVALVFFGSRDWKKEVALAGNLSRYMTAAFLLALYVMLPWWLRSGPYAIDDHYIATLHNKEERPGKYLELDRSRYRSSDNTIEMFSRERLKVTGKRPPQDAILSIKGHFSDSATVEVTSFHVHSPIRDAGSGIALAGIVAIWLAAVVRKRIVFARKQ